MAIAHVCLGCGLDLARVRVRIEPHYSLPLVTCPRCGTHAVRRRHPAWVEWRAFKRTVVAVLALLMQIAAALTLGAGVLHFASRMTVIVEEPLVFAEWPFPRSIAVAGGLAWAVATGVWLTAALPLQRTWRAWAIMLISVIGFGVVIDGLDVLVVTINAGGPIDRSPHSSWGAYGPHSQLAMLTALILLLAAWMGYPIGLGVRRLTKRVRSWRRRAWRRRLRSVRSS